MPVYIMYLCRPNDYYVFEYYNNILIRHFHVFNLPRKGQNLFENGEQCFFVKTNHPVLI